MKREIKSLYFQKRKYEILAQFKERSITLKVTLSPNFLEKNNYEKKQETRIKKTRKKQRRKIVCVCVREREGREERKRYEEREGERERRERERGE